MESLRDSIKQVLAKKENLTFGDLRFILLKGSIFKKKRKRHKYLEKIFSEEPYFQENMHSDANLAGMLKKMIENDEIIKTRDKKYKLPKIKVQEVIRLRDISNLKSYPINQIYAYTPFSHYTELNSNTRVYGINEKFLQHAEQVGLRVRIIKNINKIEEITRELNKLKFSVEIRYKAKLLVDICKKSKNKEIIKFIKNYNNLLDLISSILFVGKKVEYLKDELENISSKTKTQLSPTDFKQLLEIMKKVGKTNINLYGFDEIESLVSIVVNKPRTGDWIDEDFDDGDLNYFLYINTLVKEV
jgi:hypothetical protein